jgi:hypothetical protein
MSRTVSIYLVDQVCLQETSSLKVIPDQVRPLPHQFGLTRETPEPPVVGQIKPSPGQAARDEA